MMPAVGAVGATVRASERARLTLSCERLANGSLSSAPSFLTTTDSPSSRTNWASRERPSLLVQKVGV